MTDLVVTVPIANVLREPVNAPPSPVSGELRETQLFYNEHLVELDRRDEWVFIEAPEQHFFDAESGAWRGYRGWVRQEDLSFSPKTFPWNVVVIVRETVVYGAPSLSAPVCVRVLMGTKFALSPFGDDGSFASVVLADGSAGFILSGHLRRLADFAGTDGSILRKGACQTALGLTGVPYLWGGRSLSGDCADDPDARRSRDDRGSFARGLDCSGLVNLVFMVNGIDLPRNAHDQWLWVGAAEAGDLEAGDLVFLSKGDPPGHMDHVMIYSGGDDLIESPETGQVVRRTTFSERLGSPLERFVCSGRRAGESRVEFGRPCPLWQL